MKVPIEKNSSVIVLAVDLFGKKSRYRVNLALDTGAIFTMIPWHVAEHLGYDPAATRERIAITTASTIEKAPVITLERMKVFDVEAENVKVVVHDLPPKSRIDGLLGLSFLKHFDMNLHLKRGFIEFNDP
ncbi:MAG: TIGR02281 family clan AA aspartic protease [bacterium]